MTRPAGSGHFPLTGQNCQDQAALAYSSCKRRRFLSVFGKVAFLVKSGQKVVFAKSDEFRGRGIGTTESCSVLSEFSQKVSFSPFLKRGLRFFRDGSKMVTGHGAPCAPCVMLHVHHSADALSTGSGPPIKVAGGSKSTFDGIREAEIPYRI